MKTVACGLGKCGSRMILDLNAMLYGGKWSHELRIDKDGPLKSFSGFKHWINDLFSSFNPVSKIISEDERPVLHLGDSDNNNEVMTLVMKESKDKSDEKIRRSLKDGVLSFTNYFDACGQYHIIGEQVMGNLLKTNQDVKKKVVDAYLSVNRPDNVSCFFLMFSMGGGTGCGASTMLAEAIAKRASQEYVNLLIAGLATLPGPTESPNFRVSAGRFLTKFFSAEAATSFDTIITIGNSIIGTNRDESMAQAQANVFTANLVCSIINSSSKHNRSPINTDGPELRKNIHGLSYFCYGQAKKEADQDQIALNLLRKALQPVDDSCPADGEPSRKTSFQGCSVTLASKDFSEEHWNELLERIEEYHEKVSELEPGDKKALQNVIEEVFHEDKLPLPLAMRSCKDVVVLRGIPDNGKSTQWEQITLVTLLKELFPKSVIHYYSTYHKMDEDTLMLLPSGYISAELLDFIVDYLSTVWNPGVKKRKLRELLTFQEEVTPDEIRDLLGEREHFEYHWGDTFTQTLDRVAGQLKLDKSIWDNRFVTAEQVANMINRVHEIIIEMKKDNEDEEEDDGSWNL